MELSIDYLKRTSPGYKWIVEKGIPGYDIFTALEPWYFLADGDMFDAAQRWPSGRPESPLVAFARRQDCDDIACFDFTPGNSLKVVLIEGWHAGAYSVLFEYPTFWEWMKSVVEDMAEWSDPPDIANQDTV